MNKYIILTILILSIVTSLFTGCSQKTQNHLDTGEYTLTVTTEGNGTVTKNPDKTLYEEGATVELTATPETGWEFDYWEGSGFDGETSNTITITMDENITIKAVFSSIETSINAVYQEIPGSSVGDTKVISSVDEKKIDSASGETEINVRKDELNIIGVMDTSRSFGWTAITNSSGNNINSHNTVYTQNSDNNIDIEIGPLSTATQMVFIYPGIFHSNQEQAKEIIETISEVPEVINLAIVLEQNASKESPLDEPVVEKAYEDAIIASINTIGEFNYETQNNTISTNNISAANSESQTEIIPLDNQFTEFEVDDYVLQARAKELAARELSWVGFIYRINKPQYSSWEKLEYDWLDNPWKTDIQLVSNCPVGKVYLGANSFWKYTDFVSAGIDYVIKNIFNNNYIPGESEYKFSEEEGCYALHLYTLGAGLNRNILENRENDMELIRNWPNSTWGLATASAVNALEISLEAVSLSFAVDDYVEPSYYTEELQEMCELFLEEYETGATMSKIFLTNNEFQKAVLKLSKEIIIQTSNKAVKGGFKSLVGFIGKNFVKMVNVPSLISQTGELSTRLATVVQISPWEGSIAKVDINQLPHKLSLKSPFNEATGLDNNITLFWNSTSDPDGDNLTYDVYLDNVSDPTNKVASDLSNTSYEVSDLNNNSTYYWKVVAKDGNGGNRESDIWEFTTKDTELNSPNLIEPGTEEESGEILDSLTPTLKWEAVNNADKYALAISEYSYGIDNVIYNPQDLTGTSHIIPEGILEMGKKYCWNMQASIGGEWSQVSETLYFQTKENTSPSKPQLNYPSDGASNLNTSLTLSWNSSSDPDGDNLTYDVYLDNVSDPTNKVASDLSNTSYEVSDLNNNSTYYWKVVAKDGNGGSSESDVWGFGTQLSSVGNVKWSFDTGVGNLYNQIFISPAIDDNGIIYIGNYGGDLYAINSDGTQKWHKDFGEQIRYSPVIGEDNTIYVYTPYEEKLYAIDREGKLKWTVKIDAYSPPKIGKEGNIYLKGIIGEYGDLALYCINTNGSIKWKYELSGGCGENLFSIAITSDNTIYCTNSNQLYAINSDGNYKWNIEVDYDSCLRALGVNNTIYLTGDTKLYAIKSDGSIKWSNNISGRIVIGNNNNIYIARDKLYVIDSTNGSQKWNFDLENRSFIGCPVLANNGVMYVISHFNNSILHALGPEGTEKWRYTFENSIQGSSAAIGNDGTIYIGSTDGKLYAITGEGSRLSDSPWPMLHHDLRHTGRK